MTSHLPNTQEASTQTFDTQEASTQTEETNPQKTSTPETSTDETPTTPSSKLAVIPFITRFLLHIPTAILGPWCISTYNDASYWVDDYSAAPNCGKHMRALRSTGIVAFVAFAWNFFQFIPSAFVQGLAQGIIGIVDMALVIALFVGAMIQAVYLPQTCDRCPVSTKLGDPEVTWHSDLSDWCGGLGSDMRFAFGATLLYSTCAVMNLWLGFGKARKDAKLGRSTPNDLWVANKVSVITLPVGRFITRSVSRALGKKHADKAGAGKTAAAEETIGLMYQERYDDDTELDSLSRLSGETEDSSGFLKMPGSK